MLETNFAFFSGGGGGWGGAEITIPSLSIIFKMTHAYALTPRLVLHTSANGWDRGNLTPADSFAELLALDFIRNRVST